MSKFAYEPEEHVIVGHVPKEPRTALDLLRLLGVDEADHERQVQAVERWLVEHDPDDLLRISLDRRKLPVPAHLVVTSPAPVEVLRPVETRVYALMERNTGVVSRSPRFQLAKAVWDVKINQPEYA